MANANLPNEHDDEDLDNNLDESLDHEDDDHENDKSNEEDSRLKDGENDSDGEDKDLTPEEKERKAIQARRRDERQRKKENNRREKEALRRELSARDKLIDELSNRINSIERQTITKDFSQLDAELKQSIDAVEHYTKYSDSAAAAGNVVEALAARDRANEAKLRAQQLYATKQNFEKQTAQPVQPSQDPRTEQYKNQFLAKQKWIDLTGADDDSAVVLQIDKKLAKEGWKSNTPEYWEELEERSKKYLPHRFNSASVSKETTKSRKSVVTGSGRESSSVGSSDSRLSPDRIQALKDAGAWDNPEKRAKMIKVYADYDKSNRNR